jgi:hypothetical protein
MKQKWTIWLFNPFMYVAGWQALVAGLLFMFITAILASLSTIRFDGVIDIHFGEHLSFMSQIKMLLIDYAALSLLLIIIGMILSKSQYRFIDIIGTQLIARWPILLVVVLALAVNPDPLIEASKQINPQEVKAMFTGTFILFLFVSILVTVWMIVLMYRSYAVSFNLNGSKAIVSFIICFVLAEVFSKLIIIKLF